MTSTAVAKKPLRQVANIRELLVNDQARGQLELVAAKHMNPNRMMRTVANAIRTTPRLQECEPMSFLGALMTCAALGLEPNTPLGHAYLVPFKNNKKKVTEVQLIVGYKGFIDLAWRTGKLTYIHADVAYSDDPLWDYEHGSDAHLRHRSGPRKGEKLAAYCHIKVDLGGGREGESFAVLDWEDVIGVRDKSQGWKTAVQYGTTKKSPWATHEDRMAAKTAVRALANAGGMPMSVEFVDAMMADDAVPDFSAFATDPEGGIVVEGEVTEEDDKPEPEPEPKKKAPKKAPSKKPAKPARAVETTSLDETALDALKSLVVQVVDELRGCDDAGKIEEVRELFAPQVDGLKEGAPKLWDEIEEATDQARERVAAK